MTRPCIDIVIPVYNEENQIFENICEIRKFLLKTETDFKFLLVDDGSSDGTWFKMKMLSENFPRVKALRLSRNFGKEAAICCGLEAVRGDACIIMDADLQHPPELIPDMIRLWIKEGYDVIEGVKLSRGAESFVNKLGSHLFYNALSKLSGFGIKQASDFKLLDKKVIEAWKKMNERDTFFRGMSAWVGFNHINLPFTVREREKGVSKWSLFKLIKLAISAITAYSSLPLQLISMIGIFFALVSLMLGAENLFMFFNGSPFNSYMSIILMLMIIGSILMISIGVTGAYIAKIYEEVKHRPRYIIMDELEREIPVKDCRNEIVRQSESAM